MAVRKVRIGDVLQLQRRKVFVEPGQKYREIGLRSFGRGVFHKDEISGFDLGAKKVFEIFPGDLLISNVFAWEGAVAVAGPDEIGFIGSHRFMTWVPRGDCVDVFFVAAFLTSELGLKLLRAASPGSAGRNKTLGIASFENIEIPLPNIDEQRRIVERIQAAVIPLSESATASEILASGLQTFLADSYGELPSVTPLSRVLRQRRDWMPVDSDSAYATIGLSKSGRGAFVKAPQQLGATRLMALTQGDFVYSRLFAWQGSMALVPETVGPLYASNEFPAFEIDQELIMPEFLLGWFRRPEVWAEIEKQCTGSTPGSRNRFKESNLLAMLVPVPAIHVQRHIVSGLQAFGQAGILNVRRRELAEALPKAVRNEIFSKLV